MRQKTRQHRYMSMSRDENIQGREEIEKKEKKIKERHKKKRKESPQV